MQFWAWAPCTPETMAAATRLRMSTGFVTSHPPVCNNLSSAAAIMTTCCNVHVPQATPVQDEQDTEHRFRPAHVGKRYSSGCCIRDTRPASNSESRPCFVPNAAHPGNDAMLKANLLVRPDPGRKRCLIPGALPNGAQRSQIARSRLHPHRRNQTCSDRNLNRSAQTRRTTRQQLIGIVGLLIMFARLCRPPAGKLHFGFRKNQIAGAGKHGERQIPEKNRHGRLLSRCVGPTAARPRGNDSGSAAVNYDDRATPN
jgi:hypothetical protein